MRDRIVPLASAPGHSARRAGREAPRIRVAVVDDSAMSRAAIVRMLESEPRIEVVAVGTNGADAVHIARSLQPDVMTLDIEMPVMDGLAALGLIMSERPLPVLILSALTTPGAEATLKALERGASDFMVKPGVQGDADQNRFRDGLVARVLAIACRFAGPQPTKSPVTPAPVQRLLPRGGFRLVAIGASTGGPKALQTLMALLPANLDAGVVLVQHMPPIFTAQFAKRLNETGPLRVKEAENGDVLLPGTALLAPGHRNLVLDSVDGDRARVRVTSEPLATPLKPSVDVFFRSAAELNGPRTLGVVLTGMGEDGCEGMRAIRAAGGLTMAQDRDSCVVYGMPRACVEAGVVDRVVRLEEAAVAIQDALGAGSSGRARYAS